MEKKLSTLDLTPEIATITKKDETFTFREVTVEDWSWMNKRFGKDVVKKLAGLEVDDLMVIMFRLLENKEQHVKPPFEEQQYDDDGEIIGSVRVTGPMQLARRFTGVDALTDLANAFNKCMGTHRLSEDQLEEIQEEAKKKAQT